MDIPQRAFVQPERQPSYKPDDTDYPEGHIRRKYGHTEIWCKHCQHWHSLRIVFRAQVTLDKSGIESVDNRSVATFSCRKCKNAADKVVDDNEKRDEVLEEYLGRATGV